jgi:hypothetical protein
MTTQATCIGPARTSHRAALAACGIVLALTGFNVAAAQGPAPADEWRTFGGTWSASGKRHAVPIEGDALAAVVAISGAVALTSGEGLSRGFHGEALGFDDGQGVSLGRAVWTDERGDRIFSRLRGEPLQTGKRLVGTITGGTGRYAGLEGEFSLTWQYLLPGEEGGVQGRAIGLTGRVRRAGAR